MTVRQRVSSIVEDEALVIERIETQFRHLNGVEDVVGGLERVKFSHGVHFFALQNCQKVSVVYVLFTTCFFTPLAFSATSFHSPRSTFSPSTRQTLWVRENPFPSLNVTAERVCVGKE